MQEAAKKSKGLAQTQKFAKQVLDMLSMPMVSFEAEVCKKIATGDVADEYLKATNEILVNKVKKMITQATASLVSGEPYVLIVPLQGENHIFKKIDEQMVLAIPDNI